VQIRGAVGAGHRGAAGAAGRVDGRRVAAAGADRCHGPRGQGMADITCHVIVIDVQFERSLLELNDIL